MSLSNITVPNNYVLHCDILEVSELNNDSLVIFSNSEIDALSFKPTLTTTDTASINWFSQRDFVTNMSGASSIIGVHFYIWRLGQFVSISWKEHTNPATGAAPLTATVAIPTYARPTANTVYCKCVVYENSAVVSGLVTISTAGIIEFLVEDPTLGTFINFTNSGNNGLRSGCASYYIN